MFQSVLVRIAGVFFEVALFMEQPKVFAIVRTALSKGLVVIDVKLAPFQGLEAKDTAAFLLVPKVLDVGCGVAFQN